MMAVRHVPPASLASMVMLAAARHPDRPALRMDGETLTYAQFDRRIRGAQAWLARQAPWPAGAGLAIVAFKCVEALVLAQAALRLGWHYTVIDPRYPAARIRGILEQGRNAVLFTDQPAAALQAMLPERSEALVLEKHGLDDALAGLPPATGGCAEVDGNDVAIVFYTSGSTGVPKAVPVTHANVRYAVDWAQEALQFRADDVFLNQAHMGFDFCVLDYYNAWNAAACVVLVPEYEAIFARRVVELIRDEGVTNLWLVPSNAIALMDSGGLLELDASPLRRFLYAGEPFPVAQLARVYAWMGGRNVYNLYGPTETNLLTWHQVASADLDGTDIPLGRALAGTSLCVLDDSGRVLEAGRGELLAHSPSMFPGYGNRPDLDAVRFVQYGGVRWYRTGDICDLGLDGRVWYRGRSDSMVKIRGYRVELQEVELAFAGLPQVRRAVAALRQDCTGHGPEIAMFCVAPGCEEAQLRRAAGQVLPAYMVPGTIALVDSIPFNDRGKVDRQALLAALEDHACG